MSQVPVEDGLGVVDESDEEERPLEGGQDHSPPDYELAALRDAFVDAFNSRNLEEALGLVADDVDCPDLPGDGVDVLSEELEGLWQRSPGALLVTGVLDDQPCAVAWLPDEEACWVRAALVCFDAVDGQITLVTVPEDPDALERVECEEPVGDELDEWLDWAEWDRGEETRPWSRRSGELPR